MEVEPLEKRHFGSLSVPIVTLGTMRWKDKGLLKNDSFELVNHGLSLGFCMHHISSEYGSYELYCDTIRNLRPAERQRIGVIAKIAIPEFREHKFDYHILKKRVERYLQDLGIDRIDIVQWLDRWDGLDKHKDKKRILRYNEFRYELSDAISTLQKEGLIAEFACFPYTVDYAENIINQGLTEKFVNYYNPIETNYREVLRSSKGYIAIRPFKAGEVFEHGFNAEEALTFCLVEPISSVVVGVNNTDQLNKIYKTMTVSS